VKLMSKDSLPLYEIKLSHHPIAPFPQAPHSARQSVWLLRGVSVIVYSG